MISEESHLNLFGNPFRKEDIKKKPLKIRGWCVVYQQNLVFFNIQSQKLENTIQNPIIYIIIHVLKLKQLF